MSDSTRRGFVKNSAGRGGGHDRRRRARRRAGRREERAATSKPVVAYIHDPRTGEISVMAGEREVKFHDRKIAARIARAAR